MIRQSHVSAKRSRPQARSREPGAGRRHECIGKDKCCTLDFAPTAYAWPPARFQDIGADCIGGSFDFVPIADACKLLRTSKYIHSSILVSLSRRRGGADVLTISHDTRPKAISRLLRGVSSKCPNISHFLAAGCSKTDPLTFFLSKKAPSVATLCALKCSTNLTAVQIQDEFDGRHIERTKKLRAVRNALKCLEHLSLRFAHQRPSDIYAVLQLHHWPMLRSLELSFLYCDQLPPFNYLMHVLLTPFDLLQLRLVVTKLGEEEMRFVNAVVYGNFSSAKKLRLEIRSQVPMDSESFQGFTMTNEPHHVEMELCYM